MERCNGRRISAFLMFLVFVFQFAWVGTSFAVVDWNKRIKKAHEAYNTVQVDGQAVVNRGFVARTFDKNEDGVIDKDEARALEDFLIDHGVELEKGASKSSKY